MRFQLLLIFFILLHYNGFSQSHLTNNTKQSLDSIWNDLVFKHGGCLTGGQHVKNGKFGGGRCVMEGKGRYGENWNEFFSHKKSDLTLFLVEKFNDTTLTKIHTCPCNSASNAEVAVYALQKIHLTNWYDLIYFSKYKIREDKGCEDNPQKWLNDLITKPKERANLKHAWLRLANK